MRLFFVTASVAVLLAGCAASHWVRTDGGPVDGAQGQAMLAQCKGEAATAIPNNDVWQQQKITEAYMARNGYILSRGN